MLLLDNLPNVLQTAVETHDDDGLKEPFYFLLKVDPGT